MRRPCKIIERQFNPLGEYQFEASISSVECASYSPEAAAKMLAEALERRAKEIWLWIADGCWME